MASISQIKILAHTVTPAEASGFLIIVPVLWDSAFNDTNYVIGLSVNAVSTAVPDTPVYGFVQSVTAAGFTAQCIMSATAGDVIEIEATGTHRR